MLVDLRAQVVDAHRGEAVPKPEALAMKGGRPAALRLAASASAGAETGAPALVGRCSAARAYAAPGGRRALGRLPGPGCGLDRRPRPAGAAAGVVPGLVERTDGGGRLE